MGKSKKTLALVMALVMAFTIVPFGAWYGFKAAAEEPTTQANKYYKPITEIKHGQNYFIAVKDNNGQMRVLTTTQTSVDYNPAGDIWNNHITNAEPFDVNQPLNENVEKRATWQYNILERGKGGFIQNIDGKKISLDFGNDTSKDGDAPYVYSWPGDPISTPQRQISFKKAGTEENEFQMYDNQAGETKGNLYYTADDPRFHVGLVRSDGGPECHVFLYEKATDLPETIEFPITIRDLHGDHILVDTDNENNEIFNLSTSSDGENVNGDEGYVYTDFLNRFSEHVSAGYRKGLTKENLNSDGKIEYSPYTVIYVAHALRETFRGAGRGTKSMWIDDNPLGCALSNKFTSFWADNVWGVDYYHYKQKTDKNSQELEVYLYREQFKELNDLLKSNDKKVIADKFFDEHLNDSDTSAREFLTNNGITGNSLEILMDYKKTVNHASQLNYERIVNGNPCFDGCVVNVPKDNSSGTANNWSWKNEDHTNEPGASLMDVAWYLLNYFFEDSTAATTQLNGKNPREENMQVYSKTVTDAPKSILLKRYTKQDGSISYIYTSQFDSDWGNATTPLKNKSIDQNSYNPAPNSDTAYFCPIDNKEFKNSSNLDGTKDVGNNYSHNYGFSLQGSGKFVYNEREDLFFEFNGDDDVFLYINGKRVNEMDFGGTHGPIGDRIELNNLDKEKYDLHDGQVYDFDFFYMERNPVGSNFKIETNIRLMSENLLPQKNAYSQIDCDNAKRIPYEGVIARGDTVYYEFVATNGLPNTSAGETGTYISNLVFDDKELGVKISGNEVSENITDEVAKNMTYYLEKYNEATGEWETNTDANGVHFENVADLQEKVGSWELKPGERVFICGIPHTVEEANLGDMFSNNLYVSATSGGVTPLEPRLAQTRVKLVDVQDKTFVVDFAGNLTLRAEQLFSESELANDVTLVSATGGTYGTPSVDKTANTLEYTMTSAINAADEVKITEKFPGVSFVDDMTGDEYEYIYSATKNIKLVPANNVYYDDSFAGIDYTGWETTTGAGNVFTGVKGTDEIYGNTTDEARFTGKSHFITGNGTEKAVTAKFTFAGEGFSLYMNTDSTSGKILVKTQKKNADGSNDGKVIMDIIDVVSKGTYEGIPVVNRTSLQGHGTYEVEVTAYIPVGTTASLTGIRVYNPMGSEELGIYADTEKNAKFIELRDNLVTNEEITFEGTTGVMYIDKDGTSDNLGDYIDRGPKNEIYLANGQSIAFQVVSATDKTKLQVSARNLKSGENAVMAISGGSSKDITSVLDMYYNVDVAANGIVTITNNGAGVLALTNLKVTGDNTANFKMMVSRAIAEEAITLINTPVEPETPDVPETPEEPETPSKPQNPIKKFFDDVKNFFNKIFGRH